MKLNYTITVTSSNHLREELEWYLNEDGSLPTVEELIQRVKNLIENNPVGYIDFSDPSFTLLVTVTPVEN